MTEILHIEWRTGHMDIIMQNFFPCPTTKFNKLMKIIRMDWEHEQKIIQTMQDFFAEMVQVKDDEWKAESKNFWYYHQKEAEMRDILEDGKYPNGIPLSKEQKKNMKEFQKDYATSKRAAKSAAVKAKKDKEWFERMVAQNE